MGETTGPERTIQPFTEPVPTWPRPPVGGWTVDDLMTLPGLPRHTELIDGSLVFPAPRRRFDSVMISLVCEGLRSSVPAGFRAYSGMTVVVDRANAPEPDVLVVREEAVGGLGQRSFPVDGVALAVEVVSPDSESRDRTTKPHKYAAAGIEHFWLVEMEGEDDHPVVRVYERDPVTRTYLCTGIHRDRLRLPVPYPLDIDLTAVDDF
ncbi:uma2 domain containing protein [Streptomyces laurentii]|uniref:Uma2 domain containing protein n=1 Tax=Streptomyces laurentii TaxID=39478 RepID=A0A160P0K3_STRLU|nr:uma2 domain containing protein [Streptomyces laurentii]